MKILKKNKAETLKPIYPQTHSLRLWDDYTRFGMKWWSDHVSAHLLSGMARPFRNHRSL
jgi:hypothetical protein